MSQGIVSTPWSSFSWTLAYRLFPFPGQPEPEVTWFKDDKPIKPKKKDKKYKVDWDVTTDVCSLEIKDVAQDDAGNYTAKASNTHGIAEATVSVVIGKEKEAAPKKKKKAKLVASSKTEVTEEETEKALIVEGKSETETTTAAKKGMSVKGTTETEAEEAVAGKMAVKGSVEVKEEVPVKEEVVEEAVKPQEEKPKGSKPEFEVLPESVTATEGEEIKLVSKATGECEVRSFTKCCGQIILPSLWATFV